jgi:hypothetical protein
VTFRLVTFAVVIFSVTSVVAHAEDPFEFKQFSATMVTPGMPSQMGEGMKMYRSGDKLRIDLPNGYMITEMSSHTNYMVMANGMCMQMPPPPNQQNPFSQAHDATIERTSAGTDTVDGHPCKVESLTVTPRNGEPKKMKVWEAQDLKGFPVKVEIESSHGPLAVLYKNVSLADQDPSLFSHPQNCRQMPTAAGGMPH